jgi:8-oxo-dGTP pyrophosphatase MutT (NUDIX family)
MTQVYGVSALVMRDGLMLAVSRRCNPHDLGMPGGKVDPGERPIDAAARELFEETWVRAVRILPIFEALNRSHRAMTFAVPEWRGEPRSTEEGVVYWAPPGWLVDDLSPTFREYNLRLFRALGVPIGPGRRGRGRLDDALPGHAYG